MWRYLFLLWFIWVPGYGATTFSISQTSPSDLTASWDIADGEYLIINKTTFKLINNPAETISIQCPEGEPYHDAFFGNIHIAKQRLDCQLTLGAPHSKGVTITSTAQACQFDGGCTAPISQRASSTTPPKPAKTNVLSNLLGGSAGFATNDPLPVDEAFMLQPLLLEDQGARVHWEIADAHYLYRHAFKFNLSENPALSLGAANIPAGKPKHDKFFGDIEVYYKDISIFVPIQNTSDRTQTASLEVIYQGCAEQGICYPPTKKLLKVEVPPSTGTAPAAQNNTAAQAPTSTTNTSPAFNLNQQEDDLLGALKSGNVLLIVAAFFGAGLLLAFTPCVFPMVPILSGIITGQKGEVTTRKAFILSLVYVLAMALVYTLIGVASGVIGESIQAWFQKPWVLLSFGIIIAIMALSMFGLFTLQMPQFIQSRATDMSNRQQGGSLFGVAIMGMLSALIVGACSTPVLAVAIGYIGKTADPVLGGLGLFAMSIGMGLPLLLIGSSAGKLLPKQGLWMDMVKYVFGVLMLAVALYIIDPVIPRPVALGLWATLLIGSGIYMGALSQVKTGWQKLFKSLGLVAVIYGVIMLVGMATGAGSLLSPLKGLGGGGATATENHLQFSPIKSTEDLDAALEKAAKNNQFVMLDFYADWCKACLELETFTFPDPRVQQSLRNVLLLQADVTANDATDKALLKRFNIIGPPAILFFDPKGQERREFRLNGFFSPEGFNQHLQSALR